MGHNPLVELLNRALRDPARSPESLVVHFLHRGAPGDRASVPGTQILHVGPRSLSLADGTELPLHRVRRVDLDGSPVWSRPEP